MRIFAESPRCARCSICRTKSAAHNSINSPATAEWSERHPRDVLDSARVGRAACCSRTRRRARRGARLSDQECRRRRQLGSRAGEERVLPILFTATEDVSSPVYGMDLNDGGVRQQTLERARDTDAIVTSPLFMLQSGTGTVAASRDVAGICGGPAARNRGGAHPQSARLRAGGVPDQRADGNDSHDDEKTSGFDLYFYPADGAQKNELLYFRGSRLRDTPIEPVPRAELNAVPHWPGVIEIGDARWTIIATPLPGATGMPGHALAWMVLVLGPLISRPPCGSSSVRAGTPTPGRRKRATLQDPRRSQYRQ